MYGQGNIAYNNPPIPEGVINLWGAYNGLSIDNFTFAPANYVVLGQDILEDDENAVLQSIREIPLADQGIVFSTEGYGFMSIVGFDRGSASNVAMLLVRNNIDNTTSPFAPMSTIQVESTYKGPGDLNAYPIFIQMTVPTPISGFNVPLIAGNYNGNRQFQIAGPIAGNNNGSMWLNNGLNGATRVAISASLDTDVYTNPTQCFLAAAFFDPQAGSTGGRVVDFESASAAELDQSTGTDYFSVYLHPEIVWSDNTGQVTGFYFQPSIIGTLAAGKRVYAFQNTIGDLMFNTQAVGDVNQGRASFSNGVTQPTAYIHIGPGAATPGNGPLKLTGGTLLTAPEDGVFEYDDVHLYFTIGATRHTII